MAIYDLCPACCHAESTVYKGTIRRCTACGAIFGETDADTSYSLVKPEWASEPNLPVSKWQYYDFLITDPRTGEKHRRHGWADPVSRKILQTG